MTADSERLPVSQLDDPDMQAAPAAMERAVCRAQGTRIGTAPAFSSS